MPSMYDKELVVDILKDVLSSMEHMSSVLVTPLDPA